MTSTVNRNLCTYVSWKTRGKIKPSHPENTIQKVLRLTWWLCGSYKHTDSSLPLKAINGKNLDGNGLSVCLYCLQISMFFLKFRLGCKRQPEDIIFRCFKSARDKCLLFRMLDICFPGINRCQFELKSKTLLRPSVSTSCASREMGSRSMGQPICKCFRWGDECLSSCLVNTSRCKKLPMIAGFKEPLDFQPLTSQLHSAYEWEIQHP